MTEKKFNRKKDQSGRLALFGLCAGPLRHAAIVYVTDASLTGFERLEKRQVRAVLP